MTQPALSVAMSVYNGETHLADAIESILAQTYTDFEFLILNDGSTDDSRSIIDSYAARDSRIRPIHRENRGLIYSLNQLLDEARAPLIARMDDDDISLPDRFERQMAFLNTNPDYGVIGAWTVDINEDGTKETIPQDDHPTDQAGIENAIAERKNFLCHPVVMYRRDVVRSVGGYHKAFQHCEDLDLWLRLASVTKIGNLPDRLIKYRRSPNQVSNRHSAAQRYGTAIAHLAYRQRMAGRNDPTQNLETLPNMSQLDAMFEQDDASAEVRGFVSRNMVFSREDMLGENFNILIDYVRRGGRLPDTDRTILRLLKWGSPVRAAQLAWVSASSSKKDAHVRS